MDNNSEKKGGMSVAQRIGAVTGITFLLAFVSAGAASATATAPDAGALAGDLANTAGGAYLDGVVEVLPVLVPVLVGLWALGFVWTKLRPKRKGGI